jgi:hypothetical protein
MSEVEPPAKPRAVARSRGAAVLEDGTLAGLIGAAVVALWFLVLDIARGEPFLTPSLLGSVLFLGRTVEGAQARNVVMIFAYSGIHIMAFLAAGIALAGMISVFERNPQLGLVLVLLFLLFQSIVFGMEVTIVPALVGALGAVSVAVANLMAAGAMLWFLLARRPDALALIRQGFEE